MSSERMRNFEAACPICGGDGAPAQRRKKGLDIFRCTQCALHFLYPQPTDEELCSIYGPDYHRSWGLDTEFDVVAGMKRAHFTRLIAMVEERMRPGRVLDIGCAAGFFLDAARLRGWDAYGVEFAPAAAQMAQARCGAERIFCGELAQAHYEDGFYDAVFMSDLLEHVKNIAGFLQEVRRVLKRAGLIAVVTPNCGGLLCKLTGRYWPHYKREHLYYFSPETIGMLLEGSGFRTLLVRPVCKTLTFRYLDRHFARYPLPVVSKALSAVSKAVPKGIRERQVALPSGEMFVLAERI